MMATPLAAPELGLRRGASPYQRVLALLSAGLDIDDLAAAAGVSETAVRNWASGEAEPRKGAAYAIDDLQGSAAAHWLRSRNTTHLEGRRPLEVIVEDFLAVLAAAEDASADAVEDDAEHFGTAGGVAERLEA
jgi:transcriptional regulator with XRE-family HTH domain